MKQSDVITSNKVGNSFVFDKLAIKETVLRCLNTRKDTSMRIGNYLMCVENNLWGNEIVIQLYSINYIKKGVIYVGDLVYNRYIPSKTAGKKDHYIKVMEWLNSKHLETNMVFFSNHNNSFNASHINNNFTDRVDYFTRINTAKQQKLLALRDNNRIWQQLNDIRLTSVNNKVETKRLKKAGFSVKRTSNSLIIRSANGLKAVYSYGHLVVLRLCNTEFLTVKSNYSRTTCKLVNSEIKFVDSVSSSKTFVFTANHNLIER